MILTGANRHDSQMSLDLLDDLPPISGRRGRPRFRFDTLYADRAYDAAWIREGIKQRGTKPLIARRYTEHGSGLGKYRWVVERTFGWLNQYRRLRVRYEKKASMHMAFLFLGCILICWKALNR